MGRIDEILMDTEDALNALLDTTEANVVKSMEKLERKLINLYQSEYPKSGKLKLAQAQKIHAGMLNVIKQDYGIVTKSVTKDYGKIADIIESQFGALELPFEFTVDDKDLMRALRKTASTQFRQFSAVTENKLAQGLYDAVITPTLFTDLVDDIRNALVGVTGKGGVPLATYAKTFSQDSLMGFFRTIQIQKGRAAGLKKWLYYGDLVGSSRAWCVAHAGHSYDAKTITSWDKYTWRGKAKGRSVWTALGGYN